jgi:hypothetical protein
MLPTHEVENSKKYAYILAKAKVDDVVDGESIDYRRRYIELLFQHRTTKGSTT